MFYTVLNITMNDEIIPSRIGHPPLVRKRNGILIALRQLCHVNIIVWLYDYQALP